MTYLVVNYKTKFTATTDNPLMIFTHAVDGEYAVGEIYRKAIQKIYLYEVRDHCARRVRPLNERALRKRLEKSLCMILK